MESDEFPQTIYPVFNCTALLINFNQSAVNESANISFNSKCGNFGNEFILNNETVPEFVAQQNYTVIFVYSCLFIVAAVGNLTVFISLFRSRHRKSRISLMIRHLAIADLIVTFIMIPIEVGWRMTGRWIAGNVACKVILFLRAFGPYLSSNVLVCVSLDRYFAVLHPLRVNDARRRGKILLAVAWGTSFIYCIPQSFVFRVQEHPKYPQYKQCVSFGFFTSQNQEIAYNLLCVMFMYFIPLFVIVVAYTAIMCEISKNSKQTKGGDTYCRNGRMRLRRSDISNIERARSRTLRMTITIVVVYIWCCTPYVIITLWYMFDRESASSLPDWLQDTFFMMVVSNSCMNPIVYGSYVINFNHLKCKCFQCCCRRTPSDTTLNHGVEAQLTSGQGRDFARRVIKCFFGLRKGVASGATKSTATHGAVLNGGSIIDKGPSNSRRLLIRQKSLSHNDSGRLSLMSCGGGGGGVSSSSEHSPPNQQYSKCSFHSEPCTQYYPSYIEQQHRERQDYLYQSGPAINSVMECASSEPNMAPMCNIKININESQVYYNASVRTDRNRTRNI